MTGEPLLPRTGIVPALNLRVRVVSDCAWEGCEGKIERIETSGEEIIHVRLDGEDQTRQFWRTELALIEVGK